MGDPRATYERFDSQLWKDKLEAELRASGLPSAIQKLTEAMVDSAPLSEADAVIRQVREVRKVQKYVLFLYSLPSFDLVPVDEGFLRQDERNTTTTLQQEGMITHASNSRPCWILGTERSVC